MTVVAIDSAQSKYRTLWIADTVRADGIKYLKESRKGGKGDVLLLVYPIVSGDGFTEKVIRAYEGEVLCVVGTQCRNGYTAFQNVVVDEWMDKEGGWEKVVQVPVPSFAGKGESSLFDPGWCEASCCVPSPWLFVSALAVFHACLSVLGIHTIADSTVFHR